MGTYIMISLNINTRILGNCLHYKKTFLYDLKSSQKNILYSIFIFKFFLIFTSLNSAYILILYSRAEYFPESIQKLNFHQISCKYLKVINKVFGCPLLLNNTK